MTIRNILLSFLFAASLPAYAQVTEFPVGEGWAGNSVNTVVFRKNSVVSHDNGTQFTAWYDNNGYMVLARRQFDSGQWTVNRTQYKGNIRDAHNSISIMVDGEGYLHASWDHHGHPLRYARSVEPFSLELGDIEPMTGRDESNVTYPEFHRMGSGLIFIYRDGASGRGNLVINNYDPGSREWTRHHDLVIDGQGERNAYWQAYVDDGGTLHISWVWRESPDVASNHDMCYARSRDGGLTWEQSDGSPYTLPITAATAEYAWRIPQGSELINQTSMTADSDGNPYICTYWRDADSDVPQYRVIYCDCEGWRHTDTGFRTTPFSLSGAGTKSIPISRPQVLATFTETGSRLSMLFRDEERGSKVSLATCDLPGGEWTVQDLTDYSVGAWEPSYDTELWRREGIMDIFVQRTVQVDGEGTAVVAPEPVTILRVRP